MPYLRVRAGRLGEERRPGMERATKVIPPHIWLFWLSSAALINILNPIHITSLVSLSPRCHPGAGLFLLSFCHLDPQRGICPSRPASLMESTGRQKDGCHCQWASPMERKMSLNSLTNGKPINLWIRNWTKSQEMMVLFTRKILTFSREGMVYCRFLFHKLGWKLLFIENFDWGKLIYLASSENFSLRWWKSVHCQHCRSRRQILVWKIWKKDFAQLLGRIHLVLPPV